MPVCMFLPGAFVSAVRRPRGQRGRCVRSVGGGCGGRPLPNKESILSTPLPRRFLLGLFGRGGGVGRVGHLLGLCSQGHRGSGGLEVPDAASAPGV